MKNILPGDVVLVDRGFDIADSIGFYCGELKIPAFTKGKPQLSSLDGLSSNSRRASNWVTLK